MLFDRHWGINLLHQTMERLEATYTGEGKQAVFEALKDVLAQKGGGPRYKDLAAELGMSEGAVKVAVHRLRQRYGRILKEEIRYLFGVFRS